MRIKPSYSFLVWLLFIKHQHVALWHVMSCFYNNSVQESLGSGWHLGTNKQACRSLSQRKLQNREQKPTRKCYSVYAFTGKWHWRKVNIWVCLMYDTDHEINQSVSCTVRVRGCSDFPFSFLKEKRWLCMTAAFVNRSGEEKKKSSSGLLVNMIWCCEVVGNKFFEI